MQRPRSTQDLVFEAIRRVIDDRRSTGQLVTTRAEVVDELMRLPDVAALAVGRSNSSTLSPERWLANTFDWFTAKWCKTRHHAGLARRRIDRYWAIDLSKLGEDRCGSVADA